MLVGGWKQDIPHITRCNTQPGDKQAHPCHVRWVWRNGKSPQQMVIGFHQPEGLFSQPIHGGLPIQVTVDRSMKIQ